MIYTVFATDADDGSNAEITYSLTSSPVSAEISINFMKHSKRIVYGFLHTYIEDVFTSYFLFSLKANGPFSIGPSTGIIVLSSELDFDISPTYTVTVLAEVMPSSIH